MSLINDALKRAQQAQETAPPPGPQLRPVEEPAQHARHTLGLLLPAALAVVALLALFFVWQLAQKSGSAQFGAVRTPTVSTDKTSPASPPATSAPVGAAQPNANPPPAPVAVVPASPSPLVQSGSEVRPISGGAAPASPGESQTAKVSPSTNVVAPGSGGTPLASGNPSQPAQKPGVGNAETNAAAIADPAPPKPAPLKLQAIVFSPTRPSALIGGKTLFIGDRIGEFRLVSLTRESATMAGAGQTNVLNLAQ